MSPSYRHRLSLPAWGLYRDEQLVASFRAVGPDEARATFVAHGLWKDGDRIERLD